MKSDIGSWWIEEASFFNETMLGIGVSMEAKQKKILDPGLEYSTPSVPFIRSALICFRFYITFFDSKILKAAQVTRRNLLQNNMKASYEILVIKLTNKIAYKFPVPY